MKRLTSPTVVMLFFSYLSEPWLALKWFTSGSAASDYPCTFSSQDDGAGRSASRTGWNMESDARWPRALCSDLAPPGRAGLFHAAPRLMWRRVCWFLECIVTSFSHGCGSCHGRGAPPRKARLIVIEQKSRIERLKAAGASTLEAERVLATFEANLRFFEDSLEQVRQQKD
jgi:hypothetical protein